MRRRSGASSLKNEAGKIDNVSRFCHTKGMKVAVSIPDPVFVEAELLAKRLKAPRSEIYARALAAFVGNYAPDRVTQAMDDAIDAVGGVSDDFVRAAARQTLGRTEW